MSNLLLPKRYANQRVAPGPGPVTRAEAPPPSTTMNRRAESDDFVSPNAVREQLSHLHALIEEERTRNPDYRLPQPIGWRLQVLVMTYPEKSEGGVILVDEELDRRALASPQGVVIAMGSAAYSDPRRFSVEGELTPWCKVGDRVQFVKYDAPLYMLKNGQRLGILTDTQPIAVIDSGWEVPQ